MNRTSCLFITCLVVSIGLPDAVADDSRIEAEKTKLREELRITAQRHPEFDRFLPRTAAHLKNYPFLSVEQAFCVVSRGEAKDDACRRVLNELAITRLRPMVPDDMVPVLIEGEDGSFKPLLDTETGLPAFEPHPDQKTVAGLQKQKKMTGNEAPGFIGGTLLAPINRDAHGYGTHSDATGRLFEFRTHDGHKVYGPVELDGYGLGVHMDEFGRPARAAPRH